MRIAKRPLYVSVEELRKLFGLPEEIEIISVSTDGTNVGIEGFTFVLASAEEVDGITKVFDSESNVRRIRVSNIKELQEGDKQNG